VKTKNEKLAKRIVRELLTSYGKKPRKIFGTRFQIMDDGGARYLYIGGLCADAA
jgi:hypothetical protein